MNRAMVINKSANQIRQIGLNILAKELGISGAICFLRQFDNGYGDYTKERVKTLNKLTIDDIVSGIKMENKKPE